MQQPIIESKNMFDSLSDKQTRWGDLEVGLEVE
jgi:hypothetical protein